MLMLMLWHVKTCVIIIIFHKLSPIFVVKLISISLNWWSQWIRIMVMILMLIWCVSVLRDRKSDIFWMGLFIMLIWMTLIQMTLSIKNILLKVIVALCGRKSSVGETLLNRNITIILMTLMVVNMFICFQAQFQLMMTLIVVQLIVDQAVSSRRVAQLWSVLITKLVKGVNFESSGWLTVNKNCNL